MPHKEYQSVVNKLSEARAENAALKAENDATKDAIAREVIILSSSSELFQYVQSENVRLRAENARLRRALEYYANRANWKGGWAFSNGAATMVIDADGYIPARAALGIE